MVLKDFTLTMYDKPGSSVQLSSVDVSRVGRGFCHQIHATFPTPHLLALTVPVASVAPSATIFASITPDTAAVDVQIAFSSLSALGQWLDWLTGLEPLLFCVDAETAAVVIAANATQVDAPASSSLRRMSFTGGFAKSLLLFCAVWYHNRA
jgi:hypothetical protein